MAAHSYQTVPGYHAAWYSGLLMASSKIVINWQLAFDRYFYLPYAKVDLDAQSHVLPKVAAPTWASRGTNSKSLAGELFIGLQVFLLL